jgi:hypothetical protein
MKKSVVIPLSLLERIIELLDGLDVSRYGYNFCCEYEDVFRAFEAIMQRYESGKAYARIMSADFCEDTRCIYRIQHLLRFRNWDIWDSVEPF